MYEKTVWFLFFVFFIVFIIFSLISLNYVNTKKKPSEYQSEQMSMQTFKKTASENEEEINVNYKAKMVLDNFKGYDVCAKLEIPSIELETYVLSNYSLDALQISVTKFWGVEPNKTGNFCIAGHNYINSNMFHNLKKLKIGDTLYITDNEVGKVEYQIFKTDIVVPEDTSCLDAITTNQKEVTLITCTRDSKKRIVIKAKEIICVP